MLESEEHLDEKYLMEESYSSPEEYPSLSGTLKLIEQGETMAKSTFETLIRVRSEAGSHDYFEVASNKGSGGVHLTIFEEYGDISFKVTKEMAENLGKALILAASELS